LFVECYTTCIDILKALYDTAPMKTAIKKIREELGLSQAELAICLGKTPGAISNYENFVRQFNIETAYQLIKLARKHGLTKTLEDIFPLP
jgi:transcriptional regulator with XRE-family HTH domain